MPAPPETIVCLSCGGRVGGHDDACTCPPPSIMPRLAPDLACPRCGAALRPADYAGLDPLECEGCHGLFLDASAVARVTASKDGVAPLRAALPARPRMRETEVRYLSCPLCAARMNRKMFGRFSGVVVDVCRAHGVWFDEGELADVMLFVEHGGLERLRAREQEERAESVRAAALKRVEDRLAEGQRVGVFGSRWERSRVASEVLVALVDLFT